MAWAARDPKSDDYPDEVRKSNEQAAGETFDLSQTWTCFDSLYSSYCRRRTRHR